MEKIELKWRWLIVWYFLYAAFLRPEGAVPPYQGFIPIMWFILAKICVFFYNLVVDFFSHGHPRSEQNETL